MQQYRKVMYASMQFCGSSYPKHAQLADHANALTGHTQHYSQADHDLSGGWLGLI